jgi:hypothetical protein
MYCTFSRAKIASASRTGAALACTSLINPIAVIPILALQFEELPSANIHAAIGSRLYS